MAANVRKLRSTPMATKKKSGGIWKKITKSPGILIAGIGAVLVIGYLLLQGQNQNAQGQGQPATNPNSLGTSSAGGYYLLTEEVVSPPVNVHVSTGSHVNKQRHHITRAPSSHHTHPRQGSTGHDGSNPNIIHRNRIPQHEASDRWFINKFGNPVTKGHHVTHIAAPAGVAPHHGIGQNAHVVSHNAPQVRHGEGGKHTPFAGGGHVPSTNKNFRQAPRRMPPGLMQRNPKGLRMG